MTWHARSILIRTQSCALLLVSLTADPVFSQTAPSTLQGRVIDEQGAGLPGVLLSLTSGSAESTERSVVTDADGRYRFEGVAPGAGYRLRATIPSYATVIAEGIELPAGGTVRLDLSLRPSSDLEETIRVEARGEIVDTASGVTATVYNAEFIAGLPLLGREFSDLLTLAPGVTDSDGDGNVNVRGARDTGLQVRMDGTNTTNPLTGHQGQDVNLEIIDELEIITAGAPAEFGRADGGFANIITKSGSNEREGSFKLFYRTDFLDGDGANTRREPVPSFNDSRAFLTFSGPFVRDHLWYFASAERLDREQPTIFLDGTSALVTQEGWRAFGKTTWQADTANKLALQVNYDPLELGGNNIGQGVAAETDYLIRAGGSLPQLTWTSIMSPTLLLQVTASHLNAHQEIDPVSSEFRVIEGLDPIVLSDGTRSVPLPCVIRNCRGEPGLHRFFRLGSTALRAQREIQQEAGPYSTRSRQELARSTIRADLSYTIEERLGQHAIKSGFEFNLEEYAEDRIGNPILTDRTCEFAVCGLRAQPPPPAEERQGELLLEVFQPVRKPLTAEGLAAGAYIQDAWKPRPNLTINAGLRFDHEEIDTVGFTAFDPLPEAREALRRYDLVCDAAGSICTSTREAGRRNGTLPTVVTPPPGHPALEFDLNGNGDLELQGPEGRLISVDPFTTRAERLPATFFISNSNLAPRLSVSWDPWSDGKTKLFGTLGRYYDRLFLGTVTTGQDPESFTARWFLSFFGPQAEPGALSRPITDGVNISQTDRGLTTPYTDEWSVGVERELAPEWSVSLALIRRRGHDLLQDIDQNHITCKMFDDAFRVDPMDVCGDGGFLELDRFGRTSGSVISSNGAVDLYSLNPFYNRVLRVGNFNESRYAATELVLRKRLHRNWQMLVSYTYSKAEGDAESFVNEQGNDPAVSDKVAGFLGYDQRHVVKWQAVANLARGLSLGGTLEWASGLPFTFVSNVEDDDDVGNTTAQRVFSVTGRKNDQRNDSQLTLNGRIEKRFTVGETALSGFIEVENLFNSDELVFRQLDLDDRGLADDARRFGRRWEIGMTIHF